MRSTLLILAALLITALPRVTAAQQNWPKWRGPAFDGHAQEPIPVTWTQASVVWQTRLPGTGQSTPIVWQHRIYVTAAGEDGRRRYVVALNRHDGTVVWQREIACDDPNPTHSTNSHASASCVTDGQCLVAFFGRGGIHCFDLTGNKLWSRNDLGPLEGPWGTAASPCIVGDLVVQNCDADEDAYLIAFDKQTGKTVWRTPRDNYRGWSTPILIRTENRPEIIVNGHRGVRAYEPLTGRELWFCQGFNGRGSPTPLFVNGILIVINGLSGNIYAVRPGGNGNVTETHMVWHTPRSGRDLPSPIVVDRFLFTVSLRGIANCYDVNTGQELWKERLGGQFTASPIASQGLVYVPNEEGTTFVIQPDEKLKVVAKNQLVSETGQPFRASLVPHQGQILMRSNDTIYCIGHRP